MIKLHNPTLFEYLRRAPFGGRLTQQQVDGVTAILNAWYKQPENKDMRQLAYVLATTFHETGGAMAPIREKGGNKYLSKYDTGRLAKSLGNTPEADGDGQLYAGRGYVQITGRANYKKLGEVLELDLIANPDLALNKKIAADILVIGMVRGLFTGKKLIHYFDDNVEDAVGARRIINGTDKAHLIADYYAHILSALNAADLTTPLPADAPLGEPEPDKVNLATDKTTIGAFGGFLASGGVGAGVFSGIDNVYALAAVIALGVLALAAGWLFLSGRKDIVRKAGA